MLTAWLLFPVGVPISWVQLYSMVGAQLLLDLRHCAGE